MLKLQREPSNDNLNRAPAPMEWSESVQSWCIFDARLVIDILKSNDFIVVDSAAEYEKIQARTGVSCADFIRVLLHVPLANENPRHSQLRRDFAQLIRARSSAAKEVAGELVSKTLITVFQAGRSAELVQDVVRPIADGLFAGLLGRCPQTWAGPSPSQVFDRFLGLNRRKMVQSEVARLSNTFTKEARGLTTSVDYATALMVVGYDSLVASLGTSLVAVLQDGAGSRLCELSFPDSLPRTGVPYVERVAKTHCTMHGFEFRPGDRVRLLLDTCPAASEAGEDVPFFGKGRHLCLGTDLSQWVWRTLVQELARIPVEVRITEARLRSKDYVFKHQGLDSWMKVSARDASKSSRR